MLFLTPYSRQLDQLAKHGNFINQAQREVIERADAYVISKIATSVFALGGLVFLAYNDAKFCPNIVPVTCIVQAVCTFLFVCVQGREEEVAAQEMLRRLGTRALLVNQWKS